MSTLPFFPHILWGIDPDLPSPYEASFSACQRVLAKLRDEAVIVADEYPLARSWMFDSALQAMAMSGVVHPHVTFASMLQEWMYPRHTGTEVKTRKMLIAAPLWQSTGLMYELCELVAEFAVDEINPRPYIVVTDELRELGDLRFYYTVLSFTGFYLTVNRTFRTDGVLTKMSLLIYTDPGSVETIRVVPGENCSDVFLTKNGGREVMFCLCSPFTVVL